MAVYVVEERVSERRQDDMQVALAYTILASLPVGEDAGIESGEGIVHHTGSKIRKDGFLGNEV